MCCTLPNSCASTEDQNKIWFLLRVGGLAFQLDPCTVIYLSTDMCMSGSRQGCGEQAWTH